MNPLALGQFGLIVDERLGNQKDTSPLIKGSLIWSVKAK